MQVWKFAAVGAHVAVMLPFRSRATVVEGLGLLSGVDSRMSDVRPPPVGSHVTPTRGPKLAHDLFCPACVGKPGSPGKYRPAGAFTYTLLFVPAVKRLKSKL